MLQELRETLTAATSLVAEIGIRFKSGNPAEELIAQLGSLLADLAPRAPELPPDLQAELTQLLTRVEETVFIGEDWLEWAGPEIASLQARERLRRKYGIP